jgi:hypothetical protein
MQRSFKVSSVLALVVMFTFGFANTSIAADSGAAIKAAEASIAKAKKAKWIWRDTEKMLKKAKEAAKKGDSAKAAKLATAAKDQAELAVKQQAVEKGKDRSLKGS